MFLLVQDTELKFLYEPGGLVPFLLLQLRGTPESFRQLNLRPQISLSSLRHFYTYLAKTRTEVFQKLY